MPFMRAQLIVDESASLETNRCRRTIDVAEKRVNGTVLWKSRFLIRLVNRRSAIVPGFRR